MTSPAQELAEAARRIQGGQLAQQQHAKQVADQLAAEEARARQAPPAPEQGAPGGQQA